MSNNCFELRQQDIVRVEIYTASQCGINIPTSVVLQSLAERGSFTGTPKLTLAVTDTADVLLNAIPQLKVSNSRGKRGNTYKYDLQMELLCPRQQAETTVDALAADNFHVVVERASGARELIYSLQGASLLDIDQTHAQNNAIKLKATIQSMSHLIKLT